MQPEPHILLSGIDPAKISRAGQSQPRIRFDLQLRMSGPRAGCAQIERPVRSPPAATPKPPPATANPEEKAATPSSEEKAAAANSPPADATPAPNPDPTRLLEFGISHILIGEHGRLRSVRRQGRPRQRRHRHHRFGAGCGQSERRSATHGSGERCQKAASIHLHELRASSKPMTHFAQVV
jgi:hypothetical protein